MASKAWFYVAVFLVGLALAFGSGKCTVRVVDDAQSTGNSQEELQCVFDQLIFMRVNMMQPSIDMAQEHCSELLKLRQAEVATPTLSEGQDG